MFLFLGTMLLFSGTQLIFSGTPYHLRGLFLYEVTFSGSLFLFMGSPFRFSGTPYHSQGLSLLMYYHFLELRSCFRKFRFRFPELVPDNEYSVPVFGNSLSVFGDTDLFLRTLFHYGGSVTIFGNSDPVFRDLISIFGDTAVSEDSGPFMGTLLLFSATAPLCTNISGN